VGVTRGSTTRHPWNGSLLQVLLMPVSTWFDNCCLLLPVSVPTSISTCILGAQNPLHGQALTACITQTWHESPWQSVGGVCFRGPALDYFCTFLQPEYQHSNKVTGLLGECNVLVYGQRPCLFVFHCILHLTSCTTSKSNTLAKKKVLVSERTED
jgi:hypothetical protein